MKAILFIPLTAALVTLAIAMTALIWTTIIKSIVMITVSEMI